MSFWANQGEVVNAGERNVTAELLGSGIIAAGR